MLSYTTPEKVGVSTDSIKKFLSLLDSFEYPIHSIIMARGNEIFFEKYYAPFHRDFLHRMYSVTKSFVSLAIGFLEQDGKVNLDDSISKYFQRECESVTDENLKNQTIRHMLMMATAKECENWIINGAPDRVQDYFDNKTKESRPGGTAFAYDSNGSFILGALVERVTGKKLIDYLNEKMFNKIGVEGAYFLSCPGGHSWGDSALMMRSIDLLKSARFVMNGGSWEGEQLLNKEYLNKATSYQINNSPFGSSDHVSLGYGYQFWRTQRNSYFFNGMGSQYAICSPDKDMIFVINASTLGESFAKSNIIENYFNIIYDNAVDVPLDEYKGEPIAESKLVHLKNEMIPEIQGKINGKKFLIDDFVIKEFTLNFGVDGKGTFVYNKDNKEMTIHFGLGYNEFSVFPEEGYSDLVGNTYAAGNFYKCASSAKWTSDSQLALKVQIIDKYFANLYILIGFNGELAGIKIHKNAEGFLYGYEGFATAKMED